MSASEMHAAQMKDKTMRMSKQQSLVALAIVVLLIGAATWVTNYRTSAADDPDTKKLPAIPAKAPAGEKLKALLQERRDLAEAQFALWHAFHHSNRVISQNLP
jgi:hypothetical protein